MTIKVTVADRWQPMTLDVTGTETVAGLKTRALQEVRLAPSQADGFEVKYGGGRVRDESRTLSSLGVTDGSAFIVLSKRRRPIR